MDNLNTHTIASLYQAFDPATAFALAQRLEIHHTPKHGSWLNIADGELHRRGARLRGQLCTRADIRCACSSLNSNGGGDD